MFQIIKIWLICSLLFYLNGCGREYLVSVSSINNGQQLTSNKCFILPDNDTITVDNLQFMEYANYLKRALELKGFTVVNNGVDCDYAVFLLYGMGEPEDHHYTYMQSIYGQTGVSSANTYGTINTYGNSATYSSTTTYTPTYGVVGAVPMQGNYITFTRYARISAVDVKEFKKSGKIKEMWTTIIISTGSSGDLRRVFPVMIAAAQKYLGENTGSYKEVEIDEDSKKVKLIKGLKSEKSNDDDDDDDDDD